MFFQRYELRSDMPDIDPRSLLDRCDHTADHILCTLCLHENGAVIIILHPAGDPVCIRCLSGAPPEAHALNLAGKNQTHSDYFVLR